MPDLIRIQQRLAWKRWPEAGLMILAHQLASGWIRLAKTWHGTTNWIQAGFACYDQGCLWKNATEPESGKLVAGQSHSAGTRPDESCTPACFPAGRVGPKPDQAIKTRSGQALHTMVWAFFGTMEPNQMWEVRSSIYNQAQFWLQDDCNGCNWP